MFRVGMGKDSHRLKLKAQSSKLKTAKNLILGGVEVSQEYYLEADSDGDVIIHSLCNALSTAIGGGSLDTWAGAMYRRGIIDSKEYLRIIVKRLKGLKVKVNNVAIMVEAGRPKLEPFREKMQIKLAELLGINKNDIGIAFTSGEGLTSCGKGEGIEVTSIVLISK